MEQEPLILSEEQPTKVEKKEVTQVKEGNLDSDNKPISWRRPNKQEKLEVQVARKPPLTGKTAGEVEAQSPIKKVKMTEKESIFHEKTYLSRKRKTNMIQEVIKE